MSTFQVILFQLMKQLLKLQIASQFLHLVSLSTPNLCILFYIRTTIVLGTWAWGDKLIWGWNEELDVKAKEAFDMSILKGINTFDTAEIYGSGERYTKID